MPLETFYQTVAQLCFTLLGLWWLVLQTKYREWIGDPTHRRTITNISLYFLLPGSMSLLALLAARQHVIWQVSFFVASGIGAVETAALIRRTRAPSVSRSAWAVEAVRWTSVLLYGLVALAAVVAFIPGAAVQVNADPLTVSGVVITLLVVSGVVLAWLYFIEPAANSSAPKSNARDDSPGS